ncbi:MAG TPA: phage holin family protein [Pseudonocardiaceae bacterium]
MTTPDGEQTGAADSSLAQLVERLSAQVSALVRDEMALAAAEMKRKGTQAGVGVGLGAGGAVLAFLGLGSLVAAAVLGLALVVAGWLAALLVGVVVLMLAGGMTAAGVGRVRHATPPVPEQAVQSTKLDIETVKQSVHR